MFMFCCLTSQVWIIQLFLLFPVRTFIMDVFVFKSGLQVRTAASLQDYMDHVTPSYLHLISQNNNCIRKQ